jgi:hypothetical protein
VTGNARLNGGRGPYLSIYQKRMLAMYEHPNLSQFDKVFLGWMLVAPEPGSNRLEEVTIDSIAETLRVHRTTLQKTLRRCRNAGFVGYEFRAGRAGWVELLAVDQLLAPTAWLLREKAKIAGRSANRPRRQREKTAERPGEKPGPLSVSHVGGVDALRATDEPLSAGQGSSEESSVTGSLSSLARLGYERSSRVTVDGEEPRQPVAEVAVSLARPLRWTQRPSLDCRCGRLVLTATDYRAGMCVFCRDALEVVA